MYKEQQFKRDIFLWDLKRIYLWYYFVQKTVYFQSASLTASTGNESSTTAFHDEESTREEERSRAIIRAGLVLTSPLAVWPSRLAYSVRCSKSLCGSPLLMPGLLRTYTIGIVPTCPRYQQNVRVCVGEFRARERVSRGSEIFNINIIYLSTGSDEF